MKKKNEEKLEYNCREMSNQGPAGAFPSGRAAHQEDQNGAKMKGFS